jgi:hypothetical protein
MVENKEPDMQWAADLLALPLPPVCIDGIRTNLALLAAHVQTFERWLAILEAERR